MPPASASSAGPCFGESDVSKQRGMPAWVSASSSPCSALLRVQLADWKDADPDLPFLAEAKALCRKLGCKAPE